MSNESIFLDIQNHWAKAPILAAYERKIFRGYPDGTFRPDAPVTRAEFAAIIYVALPKQPPTRSAITFIDVPTNHWAAVAIASAYETNYLSGYPNRSFKPSEVILRVQALTALVSGLNYRVTADPINTLSKYYPDFGEIPSYAISAIAAATEKRIVVNYPDIRRLRPNTKLTRAELAALICRILKIPDVPLQYIPGLFAIAPEFDAADSFVAGLARVQKDKKWGYIDKTGKFVMAPQFDEANSFSEEWALVKENTNT